jgi:amino acid adenylation domain-containing protein
MNAARDLDNRNLLRVLGQRSQEVPDKIAYICLDEKEGAERRITYRELFDEVQQVAHFLLDKATPGDRVLILLETSIEYVTAFFGCLQAGMLAVPLYAPKKNDKKDRLHNVVEDCAAALAFVHEGAIERVGDGLPQDLECVEYTFGTLRGVGRAPLPPIDGDDVAYLQYSSGSTGSPKGVMITHANLLANLGEAAAAVGFTAADVAVGWAPLFHDLGLIGQVVLPAWVGASAVLFAPLRFVRRPIFWLQAISRYRGTFSVAPNFAYELCAKKFEGTDFSQTLDLSSWRTALIGAEPVLQSTLDGFARTFASAKFDPMSFTPAYGMAEATVFLSGSGMQQGPRVVHVRSRPLEDGIVEHAEVEDEAKSSYVGCGTPPPGHEIIVVDAATRAPLEAGRVGELWVRCASVAKGYWRRPDVTAETFGALTRDGRGPYLRTGDLGFRHADQLFIVGRTKDLIIVQGRNIYPSEIEIVASAFTNQFGVGSSAAIGIDSEGTEEVVLLQEFRDLVGEVDFALLTQRIRARMVEQFDVLLRDVVFVKKGSLPKTSSGKIMRQRAREMYLAGAFSVMHAARDEASAPALEARSELSTRTEQALATMWGDLLGVTVDSGTANFLALGGNSLLLARLGAMVEEQWTVELDLAEFFAAPVLSALAARIDARLGTQVVASREALPAAHTIPLSFQQLELWVADKIEDARAKYNISLAFRVRGELDVEALNAAYTALVARHAILRTSYAGGAGIEPHQLVGEPQVLRVQITDCSEASEGAHQHSLDALMRAAAELPFDLARDVMLRTRLFRIGAREHVLMLIAHHIAADGWSMGLLAQELSVLYGAARDGDTPVLRPLDHQYGEYALRQRQESSADRRARDLDFWRAQLGAVPEVHALPLDHARPDHQRYRGANLRTRIGAALAGRLRALCVESNSTTFMGLHAAFGVLLSRYSNERDIVIGTSVANRERAQVQTLIGHFVNTLPLRSRLSSEMSYRDLLARSRETCLAAFAHQSMSFDRLVDALHPRRSAAYKPLLQIMLVQQDWQNMQFELRDAASERLEFDARYAQFELTLEFSAQASGLELNWIFNKDLFHAESIAAMAAHFASLLGAMLEAPDAPALALPMLDAVESAALLALGKLPAPTAIECVHRQFEARANAQPGALAISFAGAHLTYADLNARANQLAHWLIGQGVKPDTLVGLCLERSFEMVIGILAILKAGAAYVPLDPGAPPSRLAFQLSDAQLRIVLTQSSLLAILADDAASAVCLDDASLQRELAGQPRDNPHVEQLRCEHLAYVIYTSGSTGEPKGVQVEHAQVSRLFLACDAHFSFRADDVWTLFHSVAFDFSVWEIWGALCYGGRLVVVPQSIARSSLEFYELLAGQGVTVLNQTPSAFGQLMAVDRHSRCADLKLRYVIFGGEALNPATLVEWVSRRGDELPQLINMYGITETTVHVTYRRLRTADIVAGSTPSVIGQPLHDLSILILDEARQLVPRGVIGEMYVGGAGLARGYLHRDELTSARFIAHPFFEGERLYKTGDLARYTRDGELAYLGRNDFQVKLRGFRIELGEVEAQLAGHATVSEAVVVLRGAGADGRLVAYVTPTGTMPVVEDLRAHLQARLPEYMVPAAFVVLGQLPLTANGKVDRQALPEPDLQPLANGDYAAPEGATEIALAAVWSELLGLQKVGRNDNFFALGGHSLLVVRLIARLQERGFAADARAVFGSENLQVLAAKLAAAAPIALHAPPNAIPGGCERITPAMLPLVELTQAQIDSIAARIPGGMANIQDIYPLAPLQEGFLFHHLLSERERGDTYVVLILLELVDRAQLARFIQALRDSHAGSALCGSGGATRGGAAGA